MHRCESGPLIRHSGYSNAKRQGTEEGADRTGQTTQPPAHSPAAAAALPWRRLAFQATALEKLNTHTDKARESQPYLTPPKKTNHPWIITQTQEVKIIKFLDGNTLRKL